MNKKRIRLTVPEYVDGVLSGNRVVLSRAITLVESTLASDQELADQVVHQILPHSGKSIRIGITGVPGVGKSTFIESFGKRVVEKGHKLAVLAVDPSSQRTKGSILGDKTRMETLASDQRAFIRPTPAGSTLGGVSAKTREAMLLCEAAGYDVIFIETVGVGQSEIMVKGMVDFFLLLMLAGAGDELQGIKKGIIEIADAIAITKADGDNQKYAKKAKREYSNALHLFPVNESGWIPQVKICSAVENTGLEDIWDMVEAYKEQMEVKGYFNSQRAEQRINWLHEHIGFLLENRFYHHGSVAKALSEQLPEVRSGHFNPISVARSLVDIFIKEIKNE